MGPMYSETHPCLCSFEGAHGSAVCKDGRVAMAQSPGAFPLCAFLCFSCGVDMQAYLHSRIDRSVWLRSLQAGQLGNNRFTYMRVEELSTRLVETSPPLSMPCQGRRCSVSSHAMYVQDLSVKPHSQAAEGQDNPLYQSSCSRFVHSVGKPQLLGLREPLRCTGAFEPSTASCWQERSTHHTAT